MLMAAVGRIGVGPSERNDAALQRRLLVIARRWNLAVDLALVGNLLRSRRSARRSRACGLFVVLRSIRLLTRMDPQRRPLPLHPTAC